MDDLFTLREKNEMRPGLMKRIQNVAVSDTTDDEQRTKACQQKQF